MAIKCSQCSHSNPDDTEFCENCGAQLPTAVPAMASSSPSNSNISMLQALGLNPDPAPSNLVCPSCQAPLAEGDEFCFNCGADVRQITTAKPVVTASSVPVATPPPAPAAVMADDEIDKALAGIGTASPPAAFGTAQLATPPVSVQPSAPVSASLGTAKADPDNSFSAAPSTWATPSPAPVAPSAVGNLRLQVAGPYGEEIVEWKDREILLGRKDVKTRVFPDVNLDDAASSRRHLAIWKEPSDGQYYAQDLESANGTLLNGRDMRSGEQTLIKNGDVLKIGTRYSIQVKIN